MPLFQNISQSEVPQIKGADYIHSSRHLTARANSDELSDFCSGLD